MCKEGKKEEREGGMVKGMEAKRKESKRKEVEKE